VINERGWQLVTRLRQSLENVPSAQGASIFEGRTWTLIEWRCRRARASAVRVAAKRSRAARPGCMEQRLLAQVTNLRRHDRRGYDALVVLVHRVAVRQPKRGQP
jgi:hypothetical protein